MPEMKDVASTVAAMTPSANAPSIYCPSISLIARPLRKRRRS
jgi:hypothetical protein